MSGDTDPERADAASIELLRPWSGPFGAPPLDRIPARELAEAVESALEVHLAAAQAIASSPLPATFENTILPLERGWWQLWRILNIYYALTAAAIDDEIAAVEEALGPRVASHFSDFHTDRQLFVRLKSIECQKTSDGEARRLLERYVTLFERAGAGLSEENRDRLSAIHGRVAELSTAFAQNVDVAERSAVSFVDEADIAGIPPPLAAAMRERAIEDGLVTGYALGLSRSAVEQFLTFCERADARARVWRAWTQRAEAANDRVVQEILILRHEMARILGFDSYAAFVVADRMARTPQEVTTLLDRMSAALNPALREDVDELARELGVPGPELAPWDWRFSAESVRRRTFGCGEADLQRYFALDNVLDGAFHAARRLFGLTFAAMKDAPTYCDDVRVWNVRDAEGRHLGLLHGDFFVRRSKRGGGWTTQLRGQGKLDGDVRPIVSIVCNFARPGPDGLARLSAEDVRVLFHEFGHALHWLLSDVTYPSLAGTEVALDFVEFPAQLFEHWAWCDEVLEVMTRDEIDGAPMSSDLRRNLRASRVSFAAIANAELLASAVFDFLVHNGPSEVARGWRALEREVCVKLGLPQALGLRHRPGHFVHVFAASYAAGYYSYLWSAILDADAFTAFEESGDVFSPSCAQLLRRFVLSAGNSRSPNDAYEAFRGRAPTIEAFFSSRGLLEVTN